MLKPSILGALALTAATGSLSVPAFAAESSNQPYIDHLKKALPEAEQPSESYTEQQKKKLPPADSSTGYSEAIRKSLLEKDEAEKQEGSYTEKEREKLSSKEQGGAIKALEEGRSQLQLKREGEIHHAAALRVGAGATREITTSSAVVARRAFSDVYGNGYVPDINLFYEYQPFHSEWFGNIGLFMNLGGSFFEGQGTFRVQLANPIVPGSFFPNESHTKFRFYTLPFTLGLNYRFNLFRILRPFVMAGPSAIGYIESRSDEVKGHYGYSRGLFLSGGVSLLLDWMSKSSSWDLYAEHGIKHYYLTLDYSRLTTFSGDVDFSVSGFNLGLTFEF